MQFLHILLAIGLLNCLVHFADSQDLQIFGKFELTVTELDEKEIGRIRSKCFWGIGFPTCRPVYQDDDFVKNENLAYYNALDSLYGAQYCVQCCGKQPDHIDTWDLYCDLDVVTARSSAAMHGFELRLAANQYDGDLTIITCPLKRSICNYDANGKFIDCPNAGIDTKFMVGYTLTIVVNTINKYFQYWPGIQSCHIDVEEADVKLTGGQKFRETLIFEHGSSFWDVVDWSKISLFLFIDYWLIYAVLFYCRRRRCLYCQNKLIFSESMCHRCKFVGADPPDPVLVAALHAKGEHLQGLMPERFPGSRKFMIWYREKRKQYAAFVGTFRKTYPEVGAVSEIENGKDPLGNHLPESTDPLANLIKAEKDPEAASFENETKSISKAASDDDDISLNTTLTMEERDILMMEKQKERERKLKEFQKEKAIQAHLLEEYRNAPLFNFFPFKWKYPKWMVKYLGFSNKKKPIRINRNLINVPKHIIYAAVGHHAPPEPDEEYKQFRREVFEEKLGYIPEDMADAHDDEHKEASGSMGGDGAAILAMFKKEPVTPAWQVKREAPRGAPKIEKSWWEYFCKGNPNNFKRGTKKKNVLSMPWKLIIPTVICITCALGALLVVALYIFNIVDFANLF